MIYEKRLSENLKEFAFPRLSGTEFEQKSFNIAKKKIEDCEKQVPYHYRTFLNNNRIFIEIFFF